MVEGILKDIKSRKAFQCYLEGEEVHPANHRTRRREYPRIPTFMGLLSKVKKPLIA